MKTNLNRSLILFILFCWVYEKANAQTPLWEWTKGIGVKTSVVTPDINYSLACDPACNVYSTGAFVGSVDFDPGPDTFNLTGNNKSIFICKLNSSGNFIWAKAIKDSGNMNMASLSIAVDSTCNVYITGYFNGIIDFDPGDDTLNISEFGLHIFILKLDSSGNFVWVKTFGDINGSQCQGHSIKLDSYNNVYVTGEFAGVVDFDPGLDTFHLNSNYQVVAFILKLDSAGNFKWAKHFVGGIFDDSRGKSIAVDISGNVYSTGYFDGTFDFDPDSSATFYLHSNVSHPNIYISKLDSAGNFVWAKVMTGYGFSEGNSIAVDDSGNVYTTGHFGGATDFDPDSSAVFNLIPVPGSGVNWGNVFISKLNSAGNFVWAKQVGGPNPAFGYYIVLDDSANVYSTGFFGGTVDFDPDTSVIFNLTFAGYRAAFFLKLNSAGNFIWAKQVSGTDEATGSSIAFCNSDSIYVCGYYTHTIHFDCDTLAHASSNINSQDMFIAKLSYMPSIINPEVCNSYTSPSGNYTWTSSGTYMDTIPNTLGCDSVIVINLIVNTVNSSVVQSGITLTANATGATYQWLDCNNGFTPINSATNQSFTATVNGSYAAAIIQNGCTDTSACFTINNVGITENYSDNTFEIVPNPVLAICTITAPNFPSATLLLYDITGRTLLQQPFSTKAEIDISTLTSGVYIMELKNKEGRCVKGKVVKQ